MKSGSPISYSDEQQMLADSVSRLLSDNYSFEYRRALANSESGAPSAQWSQFADMGWLALPFAECDGGYDGGAIELMILFERFGEYLLLEPYLETVLLAGGALHYACDGLRQRYIGNIIDGQLQAAFAHTEPGHGAERFYVATTARQVNGAWCLQGSKNVVNNGAAADIIVVTARLSGAVNARDGIAMFLVDKSAAGVDCRHYITADGRRASEIDFNAVELPEAALISTDSAHLETLLDRACFAVCAEALGAMQALLSATVDYCKQRQQFGQPIGRFQALQHRMADMYIATELVRSLLGATAAALVDNSSSMARMISALKYRVGKSARLVGQGAIQLHGGIAMTDELAVGHYFKRLTLIEQQFGNTDFHLCRFRDLETAMNSD